MALSHDEGGRNHDEHADIRSWHDRGSSTRLEAFPWNKTPKYIVRDNDRAFGVVFTCRIRAVVFTRRIRAVGIRDRPTSFRSPWQNGHVERLIGSIIHECIDHLIVLNEAHLRRILAKFSTYYNEWRPHVLLAKDAPSRRPIEVRRHRRTFNPRWITSPVHTNLLEAAGGLTRPFQAAERDLLLLHETCRPYQPATGFSVRAPETPLYA